MKATCMNCKYYKIEDELTGFCRVSVKGETGKEKKENKMVRQDYTCSEWQDCGQQYYIRLGWLKAQKNNDSKPT